MNRMIKEATVDRYSYQTTAELQKHLDALIAAYNFLKRLKTIYGFIPYEFVVWTWSQIPDIHRFAPPHLSFGLYT